MSVAVSALAVFAASQIATPGPANMALLATGATGQAGLVPPEADTARTPSPLPVGAAFEVEQLLLDLAPRVGGRLGRGLPGSGRRQRWSPASLREPSEGQ